MQLHVNPRIARLACSLTGASVPGAGFERPVGLCNCCPPPGRPVRVEYRLDDIGPHGWRDERFTGLRRYGPVLPVSGLSDAFAAGVGGTPVVERPDLSAWLGARVLVKDESVNASGSFKDRGLAVAVALGVAAGARRFCLPTQGNAGVAASLFSARLGLQACLVYMPDGHRDSVYHRAAALFGAEVRFAGPNIAQAGRTLRTDLAGSLSDGSIVDVSTFFEPGRLEGKKTMGFELFEHFAPGRLPDVVIYPTGGGTGLVGIWKAFAELRDLGVLDPDRHGLPRMVAVQSARCAPVVQAFDRGLDQVEPVVSDGTVADGLDVPGAIMGHEILRALRESGGRAIAVSDESIEQAWWELGARGLAAGFETAATAAALRALVDSGDVGPDDRVLLLSTSGPAAALAATRREPPSGIDNGRGIQPGTP